MANEEMMKGGAKIRDVRIAQSYDAGAVTLIIDAQFEALEEIHYKVSFALSPAVCNGKKIPRTQVYAKTALLMKGSKTLSTQIKIEEPKLWHPDGEEDQTEYSLHVSLKPAGVMAGGAAAAQITQVMAVDEKEYAVRLYAQ